MQKTDAVVTGYGLVAPGALDARALFALLGAHRSAPCEQAGLIDDAQWQVIAQAFPTPAHASSRHSLLIHYVAEQALAQAGLSDQAVRSCVSGIFIGCQPAQAQQSCYLAQWLGVDEYVSTHSDTCAAGTLAIGNAYRAIANGELDLALCGSIELFEGLSCTATREGAALVVLESASHAQRRGARPLGRVLGYADQPTASCEQHYAQCMQAALDDAQLGAHQICHVNLHGLGEPYETLAVKQVFGAALDDMTFTAYARRVGNGAIEAVLSLMSLQLGVLLPTLSPVPAKAGLAPLNFQTSLIQQPVETMLSNTFGAGGTHGSLVLGRA